MPRIRISTIMVSYLLFLPALVSLPSPPLLAQSAAVICDRGCGAPPPGGSVVAAPNAGRGLGSPMNPAASTMHSVGGATSVALPGSQSFTYAVPLISLPGRNGLDVSLTLYYNSFIWTASGNGITLNAVHDSPSPGFSMHFGYIDISSQSGNILVDSAGRAHTLVTAGSGFSYATNDSTYIHVQFSTDFSTAVASYNSGLEVNYALDPTRSIYRPVQIENSNGNRISIIYNNDNISTPNLQLGQIHDSVGRTIFFKYDDATKTMIQAMTEVGADGVQIKTHTFNWILNSPLNFSFTQSTGTLKSGAPINLLQSVARPNGTQVKFDYGDWGIVNKVEELSGNGALRYSTSYNFPLASAGALSANPAYTQQTVFDGNNTGVWTYSSQTDTNGLVTSSSVSDPFGTTRTINFLPATAGTALQGLPNQVLACSASPCTSTSSTLLRTLNSVWELDGSGANPRKTSTTTILEDGNTQSEEIIAYDANGNVRDVQDFDFGAGHAAALIKETVVSYAALGNGIVDRVSRVMVQYGAGVGVARTDINYDEGTLSDVSPNPVGHDSAFGTGQTARGNPTSIIVYANAANGTGGITTKLTYDVLGNVLTSQRGSEAQAQSSFSAATQFAFPDSITTGSSGNQLSTSFTYNGDGQVHTTTDANGQTTTYGYDPTGRLATVQTPDRITTTISFDDLAASPSNTVSSTANSAVSRSFVDGLGRSVASQLLNGSSLVSAVSRTNDVLGRPTHITVPYGNPVGLQPTLDNLPFTNYSYDALGRVTQVTPPSVEGATQTPFVTSYSGTTVTTTDPTGRMKRNYADALGRLVRVDEPGLLGGAAAQGSVTISGQDLSAPTSSGNGATAGTASVSIQAVNTGADGNGSIDRSTQVLTHNATNATGTVTITGSEQTATYTIDPCADGGGSCPRNVFVADTGTVSMTVNGVTKTTNYGQLTVASDIASALASAFGSNSTFTVTASGNVVSVTANTAGVSGNGITLSASSATSDTTCNNFCSPSFAPQPSGSTLGGGSNNGYTTTYDTGNVTVSVIVSGTTYSKAAQYGKSSTANSIVNDLFNQFLNDSNFSGVIRTTPPGTGSVLQFTTVATGSGTNDPLTTNSVTTSSNFAAGSTSFTISPLGSSTFQPGQNGTLYDSGTITATLTGVALAAVRETATYGQGSTAASVAALVASAFNKDAFSPVSASVAPGSATINFTAKDRGVDANYFSISIAEQSSFPAGTFSGTSFPTVSTSLSGGVDPTPSLDPSVALVTTYSYDPRGQLLQAVQGQQTRTYKYDGLGRKTFEQVPEAANVATTVSYQDSAPLSTTVTDPRGITATSSYDSFGRLIGVSFSDGTPSIGYSYGAASASDLSAGRVTQITDAAGSESYQYDNMARVTKVTRVIGGNTYVTLYAYTNGQLSSITYPSGRVVSVTPDAIGRLSQISSGGTNLLSIGSYAASGQILADTYGNGVQGNYGYNDQQQLSSIQYGSTPGIMSLSYTYGGAQDDGRITGITDGLVPARSTKYVYDELGRLKRAGTVDLTSPNTWLLKYAYDRYGNRLAQIPSAGAAAMPMSQILVDPTTNRITSTGGYDTAGNMTNDGQHAYTFNALNQITRVDGTNTSVYDYSGRRVISNGNYTIYSRGSPIAEYPNGAAASSPSAEHIYAGGQRIATIAGATTTYHYRDHLSIRSSADANGHVVRTYGHFPFGETWYETGAPSKYKFTTYERDAVSGLDYAQQRFDSPSFGRFMSLDPLLGSVSNPQSLNRYSYVLNNPINLFDPSGLSPHDRTNTCMILENGGIGFCVGGTGCTLDGQDVLNCRHLQEFAGGISYGTCPPNCGVLVGISTSAVGSIAFGLGDPESEERRADCIAEGGTHCGPSPAAFDEIASLQGVFFGCHTERCRRENPHPSRYEKRLKARGGARRRCVGQAQAKENEALRVAGGQIALGIAGLLGDVAAGYYLLPGLAESAADALAEGELSFPGHMVGGVGAAAAAPLLLYVNGMQAATNAMDTFAGEEEACSSIPWEQP